MVIVLKIVPLIDLRNWPQNDFVAQAGSTNETVFESNKFFSFKQG
jgi:hypothetical protein